jgi:GNAT superfamily N-acetyltransferase
VNRFISPQMTRLLRRIQGSGLRELLQAAAPMSIDSLLYEGEASAKCSHRLPGPFSVKSFSTKRLSGVDRIDERLTPYRSAYVVFCFGEIVHESWVCFDASIPSRFGFDVHLPVIDRSFTEALYRGRGIFPYTLSYILRDLKSRHISHRVYILVSPANNASIRGIQKAGFKPLARLKGTRLLGCLITNKSIHRWPQTPDSPDTHYLERPLAS